MKDESAEYAAQCYRELQQSVAETCDMAVCERGETEEAAPELSEMEVQGLWESGIFGNEWESERHGHVRILDFGEWNRGAGPDFLYAEVEINGKRVRGDVEIDPHAQDWEGHGHGMNPRFNNVVLHVVLTRPPKGWFTRNSLHLEVPVVYLTPQQIRDALCIRQTTIASLCGRDGWDGHTELCAQPLAEMGVEQIEALLLSAAAHRRENKRRAYRRKAAVLGEEQAGYEAWAECLGYSTNKEAMVLLARRAPLRRLHGADTEAVLLGAAGFLTPTLPARTEPEARAYHRRVWDAWWKLKGDFALEGRRCPDWQYVGIRPLNHPHRRVAALAVSAQHWADIRPRLSAGRSRELQELLCSLRHPFWERHCTLVSTSLKKACALVGRERVRDFLCNHVYVADDSPAAWEAYKRLTRSVMPARASQLAQSLFGSRDDLKGLLHREFACQALLQIGADFCRSGSCENCLFPVQLKKFKP